jgi:hypothetical protein
MMGKSLRRTAFGVVAALLAGVAGIIAFNAVDGVFGVVEAIVGLAVCAGITVFVAWRSPPESDGPDA